MAWPMSRTSSCAVSVFALASVALVWSAPVSAAEQAGVTTDDWDGGYDLPPATRRSGFTFGALGGVLIGSARGYPNDLDRIDVPEFEARTGLGLQNGGSFWLGGALTDWFTFALGVGGGSINGEGRLVGSGGAFLLRIETFPLFYRGGVFRDLGISFNAGTGGYTIKDGNREVAEGSGTAVVGATLFFEPIQLWRFSMGPALDYAHHFSRSIEVDLLVLGWRSAFYGGP
jgi:hypothetical protein